MGKKLTQKEIIRVTATWVKRLQLGHWSITIDFDELATEDNYASIFIPPAYNRARIVLNKEWPSWDKEQFNKIIVHELLHCHFEAFYQQFFSYKDYLPKNAQKSHKQQALAALERTTDALANALVVEWGSV